VPEPTPLPRRTAARLEGVASVSFIDGRGNVRLVVSEALNAPAARREAVALLREQSRARRSMHRLTRGLATAVVAVCVVVATAWSSGAVEGLQHFLRPPAPGGDTRRSDIDAKGGVPGRAPRLEAVTSGPSAKASKREWSPSPDDVPGKPETPTRQPPPHGSGLSEAVETPEPEPTPAPQPSPTTAPMPEGPVETPAPEDGAEAPAAQEP
jgi:hypothetical protein